jgi:hypothetical protein
VRAGKKIRAAIACREQVLEEFNRLAASLALGRVKQ